MQVNGQLCLITESDTLLMDFGTSGYPHCHSYTCIEIMHLSDIAELRLRFFNKREVVLFFYTCIVLSVLSACKLRDRKVEFLDDLLICF